MLCAYRRKNEVKDRITTVSLFDGKSIVTVKGILTKTQLDNAASKIAEIFNTIDAYPPTQNFYKYIFDRGVTYVVEAVPEGYENIKTVGDGKTIYIALDKVDETYIIYGFVFIYINSSYSYWFINKKEEKMGKNIYCEYGIRTNGV